MSGRAGAIIPKIQVSVPFTPVPGRRLFVRPGDTADANRRLAAAALIAFSQASASSAHVTFATEEEWRLLGECEYLPRTDQQFHFINDGFRDFGDFLAALTVAQAQGVKRESARRPRQRHHGGTPHRP